MDPIALIKKYYGNNRKAYHAMLMHGLQVAAKAMDIAKNLDIDVDKKFVKDAALLHDIGVAKVNAPLLGIKNDKPYICHGYLGREILESEGLPLHALVCERHIGVGFTKEEIIEEGLPLPHRDMLPVTIEEKLICFADKFFTKGLSGEKKFSYVRAQMRRHGKSKLDRFDELASLFKYNMQS